MNTQIQFREQSGVKYGLMIPGQKIKTLRAKYSAKIFHGKKHLAMDSELRGTVSSQPAEKVYASLYLSDMGGVQGETDQSDDLHYIAKVEYLIAYSELKRQEHSI